MSSGTPGLPVDQAEHAGMYCDVVKAADLFFSSNDFGLPTTIIDTPGTNDPFLIRDEITRRALEAADIYVVMLTAQQALSSSRSKATISLSAPSEGRSATSDPGRA